MTLAEKIKQTIVKQGEVAIFFLGQAGFCIKTTEGKLIVIDAYLSDACERLFNFKRMIPAVIKAEELEADLFFSTHEHADHLDPDALPIVIKNNQTFFLGSPDCEALYKELGLAIDRYVILAEGEEWEGPGIKVRAIFADHGDLAPRANGLLIEIDGIKIYHVGDTCLRAAEIQSSLRSPVDIMIAPINGQYGNMNAGEACELAIVIKPKIIIACHFWMFLEHVIPEGKGDPMTFLNESALLPASIKAMVMAPGELFKYPE
ncbi:MAG: MBL fold metallo-hydrolase [Ferruginibacter sp.]